MPGNLANTQDLVTINEIRQNTVILKDGSLRQILMVSGLNFSLKSTDEQNIIAAAYQNFLNSVDFPLQIVIHSRKINIEKYLDDLEKRMEEELSPLLQNQITEYRTFVKEFVQENAIMGKTFLVVVPWHPAVLPSAKSTTSGILGAIPFLSKKRDAAADQKATEEKQVNLDQNLPQLKQRVDQVIEGLGVIGLETVILNDEQLIELFYNFYNPETTERESITLPQT